jgi:hypothetical protein
MELVGYFEVLSYDLGSEAGQMTAGFCQALTTSLTQVDIDGPDDHLKTVDYHQLGMSRDDGMDEHENRFLYGCHLVGSWLGSWANDNRFCQPLMTTSLTQHDSNGPEGHLKPLIINNWACKEMMTWMSIELIGSVDFFSILAWKLTY